MCCRLGAVSFQVDSWAYGEIWIWLDVVLGSSLVDVLVYGKCRIMSNARRMFDEIENLNAITWNAIEEILESLYIIYCKLQVQEEALYRLGYTTLGKYKLQS